MLEGRDSPRGDAPGRSVALEHSTLLINLALAFPGLYRGWSERDQP